MDLRKGTSAPNSFEISAISLSSVETITFSKRFDLIADSIEYAIIGLPKNSLIFFLGILLLPPLAGIIQIFFNRLFIQAFVNEYSGFLTNNILKPNN
jgi:hypothetical protein